MDQYTLILFASLCDGKGSSLKKILARVGYTLQQEQTKSLAAIQQPKPILIKINKRHIMILPIIGITKRNGNPLYMILIRIWCQGVSGFLKIKDKYS